MKRFSVLLMLLQITLCFGLTPNEYNQVYVPSTANLCCKYSYNENSGKEAQIDLVLPSVIYKKMAYVCTAVKILSEILINNAKTNAPIQDSPNVLMACWGKLKINEGKQVTAPYNPNPIKTKSSHIPVFISGTRTRDTCEQIQGLYNILLRNTNLSFANEEIMILDSPQGHTEERFLKYISTCSSDANAVVIDIFSWLDVCQYCAIQMKSFYEGKTDFPVIFRVVSRKSSSSATNRLLPEDLSGGYTGSFNFDELRERHLVPVTRLKPEESNVIKDIVIADLQASIAYLALEQEAAFWIRWEWDRFFCYMPQAEMPILHRFPVDAVLVEAYRYLENEKPAGDNLKRHYEALVELSSKTSVLGNECTMFLHKCNRRGTGRSDETKLSSTGEWIKVLRGRAILFLPDYENHLEELCSECLLYPYQGDTSDILSYIKGYKGKNQSASVGYNFDGPDDIERKNIDMLKELLTIKTEVERDNK